jgi:hypothetical protein
VPTLRENCRGMPADRRRLRMPTARKWASQANEFSFECVPILNSLTVLLQCALWLGSWRAEAVLMHVADHLYFGHGDQPFVHHFIQNRKQFVDILLGVDH